MTADYPRLLVVLNGQSSVEEISALKKHTQILENSKQNPLENGAVVLFEKDWFDSGKRQGFSGMIGSSCFPEQFNDVLPLFSALSAT